MIDVLVSGAGPAGSSVARRSAELGLSTTLLDRSAFPRDKCCAGGLLERAVRRIGVELPDSVIEKEIMGFAVMAGEHRREFRYDVRLGVTVKRRNLDAFLVEEARRAGVEVMEGVEARRAVEDGEGVSVETSSGTLRCKYLAIADGVNSRLGRGLFGPLKRGTVAAGLATDVLVKGDSGNLAEIELFDTPTRRIPWKSFPVNGWIFPHRDGANLGVVGQRRSGPELRRFVDKLVSRLEERHGTVERLELRAHSLPFRYRGRLHTARSVILGDAAGLVNPLTGEGMGYAFAASKVASECLADALCNDDPRMLASYDGGCEREFLKDFRAAMLIGPVLHRLVGVVDTGHFISNMTDEEELVEAYSGMARGDSDWFDLARLTAPRFLPLFFSSLGRLD